MVMLNVFDGDAFGLHQLTAAINKIPEVPTKIGDLGIFEEGGVDVTLVSVERRDENLSLVGSSPRGGPGESVGGESRSLRPFKIPHFQRDDSILADEVQNVRAFGSENILETVMSRVNLKMARHTRSFDFTLENLRLGAITGVILDKDGSTLVDLFDAWGISAPPAVDFLLGTSTTNVRGKCQQVLDAVEDALEGQVVRTVFGLCGDTFFNSLTTHTAVEKTYANWQAAVNLRLDPRLPFEFGGISWIRYHTKPKAKAARAGVPMIADNAARFVAAGVPELFITRFGPADYEETVNTIGLPRYAKQWPMENGKGRSLEVQTNALCMCTQPASLQSGETSN